MTNPIGEVLDPALRDRPQAEAVVARSGSLSYAELNDAAARAAAALSDCGIRPGDRIAACLPNDLDVVVAFHGAMRAGAIWVGINQALQDDERRELLSDCGARLLLTDDGSGAVVNDVATGTTQLLSDRLAHVDPMPAVDVDPHAPAGIAYTSGTTGRPKGIVHSQRNLLLPGRVLVATRGYGPDLRKGDCLPLTILNLQVLTTLLTAQAQGCAVVMDRRDAEGIAAWVAEQRVTVWNGVPAQLFDLARNPDSRLSSLREVWSGGGDCSDDLRAAFHSAYGLPLRSTYGLTEAPTVVAIDPPDGSSASSASGQVLAHLAVAAYDAAGEPLPAGETGELCLRAAETGPWAGQWTPYLGVWDGNRPASDDPRLLHTGDVGSVDAAGWVRITDRIKLVIIRGGANVYPAEVERVLTALDDVAAAAVFGIPDERLGERVAAVVQPRPGRDLDPVELTRACARRLAKYKVPQEWRVVSRIPVNAMGKVIRTALPELVQAGVSERE